MPHFTGHIYMSAGRMKGSHIFVGWNFCIPLNNMEVMVNHPLLGLDCDSLTLPSSWPFCSHQFCYLQLRLPVAIRWLLTNHTLFRHRFTPFSTKKMNSSMNFFMCHCRVLNWPVFLTVWNDGSSGSGPRSPVTCTSLTLKSF